MYNRTTRSAFFAASLDSELAFPLMITVVSLFGVALGLFVG